MPRDMAEVSGMERLIERMREAETTEDWSFILADYLSFGNTKLGDNIAIFNIGAANDCVNLGTERCQVTADTCYAKKAEDQYGSTVLPYRRRQEFLWDCMPPELFAEAFFCLVARKRKKVDTLRFNESGDFRVPGDVVRANRVAEILENFGITVYTYTASSFLDWSEAEHITVNASNPDVNAADQNYKVVESEADVPENGFICPGECGPCRACMHPGGEGDIYEILH